MGSIPDNEEHSISRVSLFELPVDIRVSKDEILRRMNSGHLLLSYLNPYAYTVVKRTLNYASDLGRFDLVVCDGIGVQTAVRLVFNQTTPVISLDYSGIGHDYLQLGAKREMHLCLVGGEEEVTHAAVAKIEKEHPGFRNISAFGGYGKSPEEASKFILKVNPEMVLAGLGMGRQESYLLELTDCGWRGIGICVGGFFDKLAKPNLNYPKWSEQTGLRFLGRLIKEPRRLSKRYFVDYQPFISLYLKHVLSSKKFDN